MREILFRGKTYNGEWIYGDVVQFPTYGIVRIVEQEPGYKDAEVNPETVGQYTGLTDKNGRKIFEGDIIKICGQHSCFDKVEFLDGLAGFYAVNDDIHIPAELVTLKKNFIEVIDNIHDNPEMLEVSE